MSPRPVLATASRASGIAAALLLAVGCGGATPSTDASPTGLAAAPSTPANTAADDFQTQADAIKQRGEPPDWADVADRMRAVTRKHPRYALAWYNLGVAYEQLGRAEEAADAYRRALATNDTLREAQVNLASLAVERGDRDEAVSHLEMLVARDSGAVGARVALAGYRLQQSAFEEAERLAKEALARAPENIGGYCVLGHLYARNGDRGRARLVVAQGLKVDAEAACLHLALGRVLLAEKKTAEALDALQRAVQADGRLTEARFLIAEISMSFKDFNRAIAQYRAVTEQMPKLGAAWVNLGVAYKGSGRFDEAEKAYLAATALPEAASAAHFNLGVLYLRHFERLEDAEANLRRFVELADGASDDAQPLIAEVEQLKRFKEQEAAMAEEAARQAEIERRAQEEEAARAAATDAPAPPVEAEAEQASKTPDIPKASPKENQKTPTKGRQDARKRPPKELEPDDFE